MFHVGFLMDQLCSVDTGTCHPRSNFRLTRCVNVCYVDRQHTFEVRNFKKFNKKIACQDYTKLKQAALYLFILRRTQISLINHPDVFQRIKPPRLAIRMRNLKERQGTAPGRKLGRVNVQKRDTMTAALELQDARFYSRPYASLLCKWLKLATAEYARISFVSVKYLCFQFNCRFRRELNRYKLPNGYSCTAYVVFFSALIDIT